MAEAINRDDIFEQVDRVARGTGNVLMVAARDQMQEDAKEIEQLRDAISTARVLADHVIHGEADVSITDVYDALREAQSN